MDDLLYTLALVGGDSSTMLNKTCEEERMAGCDRFHAIVSTCQECTRHFSIPRVERLLYRKGSPITYLL